MNYRIATEVAISELKTRPLTLNLIKSVHEVLMDHVRGHGTFRTMQNWIGSAGCSINEASFVPPSPFELLKHLGNLEKYFHFKDVDLVAQDGIIHAQFELIHPFMDGNGRPGRMLIPLFLFQHGVISTPSFYAVIEQAMASKDHDVSDAKNVEKLIEEIHAEHGQIDVLLNGDSLL